MSILKTIFEHKKTEVRLKQALISTADLMRFPLYQREPLSLSEPLKRVRIGIIAEFKRRSPSRSVINSTAKINEVTSGYETAGATGISVLTDNTFFGGSIDDLLLARSSCSIPILRKDFIYHPYQVHEAKAYGADVILLIAAMLDPLRIESLNNLAHELGMETLLEIHNREELENNKHIDVDMIGVNNRNLKTFEVNLETSKKLSGEISGSVVRISESGIHSAGDIRALSSYGFSGFLIGESFMKRDDPGYELKKFLKELGHES